MSLLNRVTVLLILSLLFVNYSFAQKGKDGLKIVTGANVVVNEYGALTADAVSGNSSLQVANSSLNVNNRFTNPLGQGDLIMIIQMQGATINGTSVDSTWGAITNYNNCGLYEFSEVGSVPNLTTINLNCALKNSYTVSGKVQVIRVPRYSSLRVNNGGLLTCDTWDGAKGGVVALEVSGNTTIDSGGIVNATARGFRGGALQNSSFVNNITGFATTNMNHGAQKGEGIAGYQADYNVYGGMYGRGAPANGGGGGNSTNTPGGGGANAGNIQAWTGNGNPDTSTNSSWISAWNLEYPGFANVTSSGGGRGGYAWAGANLNPLTVGPGNGSWGGDSRRNHGGKGGRPLDYSTGRIFLGGGGGAGHHNDNRGGRGGNGGGLVYLLCDGTVSGNGSVISNGEKGQDGNSISANGDGSGGGGGGGSILIHSNGAISGISIKANGGAGGNQLISSGESEGPGGGGGGGYIAISNGNVAREALGGVNGTTNSSSLINFPPNGATKGGNGYSNETITTYPFSSVMADAGEDVSICAGVSTNLSATGGATYSWSPAAGLTCDTCPVTSAAPSVSTVYTVTVSVGACTSVDSVEITVLPVDVNGGILSAVNDSICPNANDTIFLTSSLGAIQWQVSSDGTTFTDLPGDTSSVYFARGLTQTTYYRVKASGICGSDSSNAIKVVVNAPPVPVLSAEDSVFCSGDSTRICSSNTFDSYLWNTGEISDCIVARQAGAYWLTVTDDNGCSAISGRRNISIHPVPSIAIVVQGANLFSFNAAAYQWYFNGEMISGANGSEYTADQPGDYSLGITDANGCTSISTSVSIEVTGINDALLESDFSIYPNPFYDVVYIQAANMVEIEVYDILGKIVFNERFDTVESTTPLDLSGLAKGMYLLRIRIGNAFMTKPIVKQ